MTQEQTFRLNAEQDTQQEDWLDTAELIDDVWHVLPKSDVAEAQRDQSREDDVTVEWRQEMV